MELFLHFMESFYSTWMRSLSDPQSLTSIAATLSKQRLLQLPVGFVVVAEMDIGAAKI